VNEPERRTNVVFWALAALVYAAYIGLAVTISPNLLAAAVLAVIPALRLTSHEATAGLGIGLGSGWTVGVLSMGPRLDEQGFVQAMMMAVAAAYSAQMLVLASRQGRSWWWEIGMVLGFGIWLAWVKYTMGPLPFPVKP
jgi:hypothetical protein